MLRLGSSPPNMREMRKDDILLLRLRLLIIMSKVYFDPVHLTGFYMGMSDNAGPSLVVTEDIASRILTLPLYPDMADEDVDRVVGTIKEYLD